ncbi:response regulator [Paenibacillus sp. HWE-109]|uniref:response regulator transcription factor n=1 Tax=Paenibacillus sp. HWE-109 TaxID=1306526 RepID=UPI001EE130C6|nr:response regulator [Paenibacillus sp. HWE-109]UKS31050.1 response regulator [Paenibacillus sp. HWE-109]
MPPYTVIVVEDEEPARRIFRQMIELRSDLFTCISDAENGSLGLEQIKQYQPHFVITDITMPKMSGLDMLRNMQDLSLKPHVLILSCHEDFHFAQQAMGLGASSYLLKDHCLNEPHLLTSAMEQCIPSIRLANETNQLRERLEHKLKTNQLDIDRSAFLDMMLGNETAWLSHLKESGYPLHEGPHTMFLIELDRRSLRFSLDQAEELKIWQFACFNVMFEVLGIFGPSHIITLDRGRFMVIGRFERDDVDISAQLGHSLQNYLKMPSYILQIKLPDTQIETCLPVIKKCYQERHPFFYQTELIAQKSAQTFINNQTFTTLPAEDRQLYLKQLRGELLVAESPPASNQPSRVWQEALHSNWQPDHVKALYLHAFAMIQPLPDTEQEHQDLIISLRKDVDLCQTFGAVHDATSAAFHRYQLISKKGNEAELAVADVIQAITSDLSKTYSLEALAESCNYNSHYLGQLFKKVTGELFSQYITNRRLERAKLLLLTTELKTYEVAHRVGLPNYRHFNRMFKKATNCSPSEFRDKFKT